MSSSKPTNKGSKQLSCSDRWIKRARSSMLLTRRVTSLLLMLLLPLLLALRFSLVLEAGSGALLSAY